MATKRPAADFFRGAGATPEPWNGERKLSFPGKLPTEAKVYGEVLSEEELRETFDRFDANKNGVMERDEFLAWYKDERHHFGMEVEEEVEQIYKKHNLGESDTISYEKWCVIMLGLARQ
jgi:Ca2+-binding EF-hand superfamily protein|eukprot:CAMPEP_0174285334 /NCGR_PEP_ID=MMETSP0809-20121228/8250_1 /TAXON_ID=73025 ORGANISM="Eutreptiella gymnastica-like, Strain CCMP1594" /NCGR_SAMPLE_ID=MMETSP0809 /ASSEMBLY_ACC=CAM_ASM_000658 /LENGTH=118 /DNA_ID=CAMNT_0015381069 /DNA_START=34 /DNA_END=390 /DNA_ORIENTATION=+